MAKYSFLLRNNDTTGTEVEVTSNKLSSMNLRHHNKGEGESGNERQTIRLFGRVKLGKTSKIGEVKFTANTDYKFSKNPNLLDLPQNSNTKNRLKLKLQKVTRDSDRNKTEYLYDLMYEAKQAIGINGLSYNINADGVKKADAITAGIKKVDIGDLIIKPGGEKRKITIYGPTGSTGVIIITKFTDIKDSNGTIISVEEEGILSLKGFD